MVVDFLAWHDSESATTPSERPCCKLPTNPLAMGLIPNSTPTTADRDSLTAQVAQLQQASTHTTHELAAIASSKFWKLRQTWVQFKKNVDLAKSGAIRCSHC